MRKSMRNARRRGPQALVGERIGAGGAKQADVGRPEVGSVEALVQFDVVKPD